MSKDTLPKKAMMGLGKYEFSIDTAAYNALRRSSAYRWQAQGRLQRQPAQQYVGIGTETISLNGMILPHYKGGLGQVDAMRRSASQGKPLQMIISPRPNAGEVLGKWCITRIEETQTEFTASGVPHKIEFTLSLTAYGADFAVSNPRR